MKKAIFTIVAKNYIGLANILKESILDKDIDFYIITADNFGNQKELKNDYILEGENCLGYTQDEWVNMSFKYTLTEFCTAIKPASFQMLLNKGYEKIIYFDPDIKTYSSLTYIWELLDNYSVVITPQIAEIHIDYKGNLCETDMHLNGIYNLGFMAIKQNDSTIKMLEWWKNRLRNQCFMDKSRGLFTDQKWIDFLPGFQLDGGVYISHHLGMNLAPWNYFERKVEKINDKWFVRSRENNSDNEYKLIFAHFSGYKYKEMASGEIVRQQRALQPSSFGDIDLLLSEYTEEIKSKSKMFNKFIDLAYSYSKYNNGDTIDRFHRRLYNGLIEQGEKIENPFKCEGDSFYKKLKSKKLIITDGTLSPDKINMINIEGLSKKKYAMRILFRILKNLMGYKRYVLFSRALPNYYRPEEHLFLLK